MTMNDEEPSHPLWRANSASSVDPKTQQYDAFFGEGDAGNSGYQPNDAPLRTLRHLMSEVSMDKRKHTYGESETPTKENARKKSKEQ